MILSLCLSVVRTSIVVGLLFLFVTVFIFNLGEKDKNRTDRGSTEGSDGDGDQDRRGGQAGTTQARPGQQPNVRSTSLLSVFFFVCRGWGEVGWGYS